MRTRNFLRLCFGMAAALCLLSGLAGGGALLHAQAIEGEVRSLERVHDTFQASLRNAADLLLSSGSSTARLAADAARAEMATTLREADAASTMSQDLRARLAQAEQSLDAFLKRPKVAVDDDDSLVAYGKLNADASAALVPMDQALTQAGAVAAERVRLATIASLVAAAGISVLVLVCGALARRHLERRLGGELEEATALLARVGAGDLSPIPAPPQAHSLIGVMAGMVQGLGRMIGSVRDASSLLSSSSTQIAAGNTDLSQRTETTAGRLQLASSSMTQLTGSVNQAAASADSANELMVAAAGAAERGGEVVQRVVGTMGQIQASSRRIGDIIGVIDSIAFQTNILALNAAVEAARAGEQGRGFAVVASEVRGLAQRSAEAAREIKSLIGSNVERVDEGSRLASDAGTTMEEIVASVRRVSSIIGEITHATREQSQGIGQVSDAVCELDTMTQQNAALVEQSAAAAADLRRQAGQLNEVVAAFRLAGQAAG
ncbi:MAG: hypothetical protein JNN03_18190 [Rubrivivax sp.]|nr:hypothetical protein [Rubrivivax sp.]